MKRIDDICIPLSMIKEWYDVLKNYPVSPLSINYLLDELQEIIDANEEQEE